MHFRECITSGNGSGLLWVCSAWLWIVVDSSFGFVLGGIGSLWFFQGGNGYLWICLGSTGKSGFSTGCVCVYVCVCLRVNHNDVIWLGVKVDQGLSCLHHHIPRSSGKPL